MSDPTKVTVVDKDGRAYDVDPSEVASLRAQGMRVEGDGESIDRIAEEARRSHYTDGAWNKGAAVIAGAARTVSGGMSDAALAGLGAGEDVAALRDYNPGASLAGEIGGAFIPVGLPGLAARAGKAVGKVDDAAGIGARIAGAAKGAAVEGAIYGAGTGVSEVALSKDPLTLERAISSIGSSALFGGAVGGGVGAITKAAGVGLRAAQSKLDDIATRATGEADDAAKVALRDEVAAFRKELKTTRPWEAAEKTGIKEMSTVGARTMRADRALDRVLDDPKILATRPQAALGHLRIQEAALQEVMNKTDEVRAALVAQKSTRRLAALDQVAPTLEKNRALQAKIEAAIAKPTEKAAPGFVQNMVAGSAFGIVAGAVGSIAGPTLGTMAGGLAAKVVTDGFGKLATKQAARASKAIGTFLDVAGKAAPVAPVLASKTLASLRFGEGKAPKAVETKPGKPAPKIAAQYKRVTDEVKQLTMYGPDGKTMMRPEARAKMAAHFDDMRQVDPIAADKAETLVARRVTAISDRLARKPDVFGLATGQGKWQPSDMQMRADARFIAAVEDPMGVVERLATGQVTTEDRDAMKQVYPEMYADIQAQIMAQLPTLQKTLPYHRRLALSLFSGMPVDPAMHPRIIEVLQASFTDEAGSEGGMQAPKPEPSFGSVRNQEATPSQQRGGLT